MSLDITRASIRPSDRQIKFTTTRGPALSTTSQWKMRFFPLLPNILPGTGPDKEGAAIPVEAERMKRGGGKKGREKKGEEKAERGNITGKSATREAANSQKGYFNLMSVNRITFRLSQAAVAATNTCSLHARDRRLPRFVSFVHLHHPSSPLSPLSPPRAVTGMLILV